MQQSHSELAYRLSRMAQVIASKYQSRKKMSDEDQIRFDSLRSLVDEHARAARFENIFIR